MAIPLVLFLFPAAVLAGITTEISGNFDPSLGDMVVVSSGEDISLTSDTELGTFQLTESNLKYSALQQFGKAPEFIYTFSPNFWGDMFQINNWTQVTTIVKPSSAKVLNIVSEPKIVIERMFKNDGPEPVTYNVDTAHHVSTEVSSSWVNHTGLTVNTDITYSMNIDLPNKGGVMSLSFTSPWGANTNLKHTMDTGSASIVRVPVQPGRTVKAEFHALKATVSVAMDYVASVAGDVVAHYDPEYKDHKFWEMPVTTAMTVAGLPEHVTAREVMHITCLIHSRVVVSEQEGPVEMAEVLV